MSRRPNPELKAKILCAAYQLMFKNGYKGVSMDDVAKAAGVKKPNLFHYYPTKESLGLAVFDHAIDGFQERLAASIDDSKSPVEVIEAMFENAASGMRERCCAGGCFVGNIAQELSDTSETIRQKVANHLQRWTEQIARFFEFHRGAKYFRPEFNSQAAAQAVISLFEGAMLQAKARRDVAPIESAKVMAVGYLNALRSPASFTAK